MQSYAYATIQPPLRLVDYRYPITSGETNTTLGETTTGRTLGVQIDRELKFNQQVEMVANKANIMLRLIRTPFIYLDEPTIKKGRVWSDLF